MNAANTAFVLMSAALVMLMTPGLALFYGGMVRSKNILAPSWKTLSSWG
jgi:ammonium transporter, Amt family